MNDGKMWVYLEIQGKKHWGNLVEFEEALDVAEAVATLARHGLNTVDFKVGFADKRSDLKG